MATVLKNLSDYDINSVPNAEGMRIGIVVAEWNIEITGALLQGAIDTLKKHGVNEDDINVKFVPGTFELSLASQLMLENSDVDSVIALGCVIQGETRHFDFICQGVAAGITQVNLSYSAPVIFGVLTTNDQQQALDRAGGKHGNKGDEAAVTAIKMVALQEQLEEEA